jgi:hypothetical protein
VAGEEGGHEEEKHGAARSLVGRRRERGEAFSLCHESINRITRCILGRKGQQVVVATLDLQLIDEARDAA